MPRLSLPTCCWPLLGTAQQQRRDIRVPLWYRRQAPANKLKLVTTGWMWGWAEGTRVYLRCQQNKLRTCKCQGEREQSFILLPPCRPTCIPLPSPPQATHHETVTLWSMIIRCLYSGTLLCIQILFCFSLLQMDRSLHFDSAVNKEG